MNLNELVDYITTKAQLLEQDDIDACKKFVSKRYEMIWNQYLWKDSLVMLDVAVNPSDENNAAGIILLPEEIDRVVAIRTGDQSVRVQGLEHYYQIDYDNFSKTGKAVEFAILNPIWFVWRGTAGLKLVSSSEDAGVVPVKITWRGNDNIRHVDVFNVLADGSVTINTNNSLIVSGAGTSEANGTYAQTGNDSWRLTISDTLYYSITLTGGVWRLYETTGGDSTNLFYQASDLYGTWANVGGDSPAPSVGYANPLTTIEVESVFKAETNGTVSLSPIVSSDSDGGELSATETKSPSFQRIRLFNKPVGSFSLNVLGKKKFVPLDFDSQEPVIRNLDNCLIAFGMADLLQRERQFAKSAQQMTEGLALLSELAKLEVLQAANYTQFQPTSGYGDPYFSPSSSIGAWM